MLDLKSLNTILFSNKESELKIAIKKIREQFEPEEAKNILSYAKVYNEILNVNSLDIELNKPIKVINDEEIINKFYDLEKDSPLFSFSSFARLVEIKKSISQAQINTVKKNYSKLEIKNKELANAKKANDTSKIQQLTNEIRKLQSYLDDTQAQVT